MKRTILFCATLLLALSGCAVQAGRTQVQVMPVKAGMVRGDKSVRSWKELRRAIYGYGVGVYAFWTQKFLVDREWYVIPVALHWLLTGQIPTWLRSLLRLKNAPPLDLISLEIWGCLMGPWAYLKSRQQNSREIA